MPSSLQAAPIAEHAAVDNYRTSSSSDLDRSTYLENESRNNASLIIEEPQPFSNNTQGLTKPSLTFLNGLALVIGLQIGSGIFSAPSQVSNHVPAPGPAVLVWLCAGLLVWTGAASFIELGLNIPANGGVQEYLRACYGEFWGFLFTLVYIVIAKPCANAIIAMVFAENVGTAFSADWKMSLWQMKCIAFVGLSFITFINCLGSMAGARAAISFLALKLFAVFSIGIIGIGASLNTRSSDPQSTTTMWFAKDPDQDRQQLHLWTIIGEYITAVYGALFCYGGWETIGFVAGDMINPSRDLPRVITTAMLVAVTGFVLMNLALFMVLPFDLIRKRSVVAVDFGLHVFGSWGAFVYSLIVSASCLGALNANVFATGRLCVAASKQDYFPAVLANRHCVSREGDALATRKALNRLPKSCVQGILWFARMTETLRWNRGVPIYAIIGNSLLAALFILTGTFNSLVTFIGIAEYTFFLLATAGIFFLRRQHPSLRNNTTTTASSKPYRTNTFIVLIFCAFATCLVVRGVITDPMQGVAICVLGLGAFIHFQRRTI